MSRAQTLAKLQSLLTRVRQRSASPRPSGSAAVPIVDVAAAASAVSHDRFDHAAEAIAQSSFDSATDEAYTSAPAAIEVPVAAESVGTGARPSEQPDGVDVSVEMSTWTPPPLNAEPDIEVEVDVDVDMADSLPPDVETLLAAQESQPRAESESAERLVAAQPVAEDRIEPPEPVAPPDALQVVPEPEQVAAAEPAARDESTAEPAASLPSQALAEPLPEPAVAPPELGESATPPETPPMRPPAVTQLDPSVEASVALDQAAADLAPSAPHPAVIEGAEREAVSTFEPTTQPEGVAPPEMLTQPEGVADPEASGPQADPGDFAEPEAASGLLPTDRSAVAPEPAPERVSVAPPELLDKVIEAAPESSRRLVESEERLAEMAFGVAESQPPRHTPPPESGRLPAAPPDDFDADVTGVRDATALSKNQAPSQPPPPERVTELVPEVTHAVLGPVDAAADVISEAQRFVPTTFAAMLEATLAL